MSRLTIDLDEHELERLGWNEEQAELEWRVAFAVALYRTGRYSAGAAAARAGIPVTTFNDRRADFGLLTFDQTPAELERDLAVLEDYFA